MKGHLFTFVLGLTIGITFIEQFGPLATLNVAEMKSKKPGASDTTVTLTGSSLAKPKEVGATNGQLIGIDSPVNAPKGQGFEKLSKRIDSSTYSEKTRTVSAENIERDLGVPLLDPESPEDFNSESSDENIGRVFLDPEALEEMDSVAAVASSAAPLFDSETPEDGNVGFGENIGDPYLVPEALEAVDAEVAYTNIGNVDLAPEVLSSFTDLNSLVARNVGDEMLSPNDL